jgi:hypothetical protein
MTQDNETQIIKSIFKNNLKWTLLNTAQTVILWLVGIYIYRNNIFSPSITIAVLILIVIIWVTVTWYISGKRVRHLYGANSDLSKPERK